MSLLLLYCLPLAADINGENEMRGEKKGEVTVC